MEGHTTTERGGAISSRSSSSSSSGCSYPIDRWLRELELMVVPKMMGSNIVPVWCEPVALRENWRKPSPHTCASPNHVK